MQEEQLTRAKLTGKQPFRLTLGTQVRYTLAESDEQCKAKFRGWDIKLIDWNTYEASLTEVETAAPGIAPPFIVDAPVLIEYTSTSVPKVTFAADETRLKVAHGTPTNALVAFCAKVRQRLTLTQTLRGRLIHQENEIRLTLSKANKEHAYTCRQKDDVLTIEEYVSGLLTH